MPDSSLLANMAKGEIAIIYPIHHFYPSFCPQQIRKAYKPLCEKGICEISEHLLTISYISEDTSDVQTLCVVFSLKVYGPQVYNAVQFGTHEQFQHHILNNYNLDTHCK
jgi:hypothetical protein